ncbi:T9SS type A sorting domain-containing protein [candidate division KSB1 bacterium]|nr:T9SS type A sorting domain-containing protein [candidate division KSB1 bacterium]MBL7092332.1 T9SS type A sorting domain-containing protein [candidate division KSB1 bacterium]
MNNNIPEDYLLSQNYPNPFNPTTEITFALPKAESVKLSIYNTNGQLIRTLVNGFRSKDIFWIRAVVPLTKG